MRIAEGRLALIIVLVSSILLAACSNNGNNDSDYAGDKGTSGKQSTLRFMVTSENYSGRLKDVVANYEAMSGNTVDVQLFPAAEFDNMLKVKMMSGEGPDLFVTDDIAMSQFQVPKDWFEDLSDRPWVERLSVGGKAIIEWNDGRITGLPITNPGGMGMIYNKALFRELRLEVPVTWEEFLAVCEAIKQSGVVPVNIQLANGSEFGTTHLMHQLFINAELNRGAGLWEAMNRNELKLTEVEEFEQSLQQMLELKAKQYINEDFISNTFEMTQEKLGTGKVAMHPGGDFILEPLLANYPDVELGFFSTPFGNTPGAIALYAGVGISVNAEAANKAAALDFIDFFATKEEQEAYMEKAPGTSVFADVQAGQNMISRDLQQYMDNGKAFIGMFGRYQVWNDMDARKMMQEMMLGGKDAKRVLEELRAKADLLGKGKKLPGWSS